MRLRLVTFNIWGLPWGLAADLEPRIRAIGDRLGELEADIVAFQEVWTADGLEALTAAGRRAGLGHAWHHDAGLGGSGLLVLSRLPIAQARFAAYEARGLPDRVWHGDYQAGKGFAWLQLETPVGVLGFVDTHLLSQYSPDHSDEYAGQRMAQVVQLATQLERWEGPLLVAGDFNLREDQPHHRALLGLTGLRDAARELDLREATVEAGNPYSRARPRADARIDYVLLRDGRGLRIRPHSLRRVFRGPPEGSGAPAAYSDHAGLLAELTLEPGAARGRAPDPAALEVARGVLERGRREAQTRRVTRASVAVAGVGVAAGGWLLRRRLTRRAVLWKLAVGLGLLAGGAAAGLAARASAEETRALDLALARLADAER